MQRRASTDTTQRLETLEDAAAYLEGLINRERAVDYAYRRLDLRPIEALMDALGAPQNGLSILHVAGSKGKGSTCLFAESLLGALGESVGATFCCFLLVGQGFDFLGSFVELCGKLSVGFTQSGDLLVQILGEGLNSRSCINGKIDLQAVKFDGGHSWRCSRG